MNEQLTSNQRLVEAAKFAADVLAELYAKYGTKIGPFASQAQKANVMLGAALRAADEPPASRQIMEALDDARAFVERHSEPWYLSGQQLLQQIDEAIAAEYERAAQPPDVLLGRRDP